MVGPAQAHIRRVAMAAPAAAFRRQPRGVVELFQQTVLSIFPPSIKWAPDNLGFALGSLSPPPLHDAVHGLSAVTGLGAIQFIF
ncbi:MAG: hypothetical protein A3G41_06365 [Elusimicrobia bacterium RIFCSPLOWO2_12_FULL_59_9]|nr:MAG: hypothetical protein A3G41_06365 [Elusimicrobia bacterium RIFCSPLOWO2_12_FULL_59_9]